MLESTGPGFLKKDVYRHAQGNNLPLDLVKPLTDSELLKLEASKCISYQDAKSES